MKNPDQYILCNADTVLANGCSNLEWAKGEAMNRAKSSGQPQVLYRLVPIFRVDVEITRNYPVTDLEK